MIAHASMRSRRLALAAAIVVLGLFAYLPGLGGGYVFDDIPNIVDNASLHVKSTSVHEWTAAMFSSPASDLQRPLAMLSFAVNHYFGGLDPKPMKLVNIAIHLLNGLLVFELVRRLIGASRQVMLGERRAEFVAAFVAACWTLNPINLMGVLYVVQRMESLSQVFVLAGLLMYVDGRTRQIAGGRGWKRVLCAFLVAMPLGTLAKESAVLLPLYAFCIEIALLRFASPVPADGKRLKALFAAGLWLPAALALAWLLPRSLRAGAFSGRNFDMFERLLTEGRVLVDYLHWSIVPDIKALGLYHDDYPISHGWMDPPSTLMAWSVLAALLLLAFAIRGRRPLTSLGLLLFFAGHSITASFLSLELVFEHRNYFSSFGLMLAIGDLTLLWPGRRRRRLYAGIVATFLLVFYAAGTWIRATEWSNPLEFARSEAIKHPRSPRAQYDLARLLVIQTGYRKDSPYWQEAKRALEAARKVPGCGVMPAQALLIFAGRGAEPIDPSAWSELEAKFRAMPIGPEQLGALAALTECANAKSCDFPQDRMIAVFDAALERGDNPEILNVYGAYALNSLHDVPFALRLWNEALRLRPSEPQYHVNLIRLAIAMNDKPAADAGISKLEALGRFGQTRRLAQALRSEGEKAWKKQRGPSSP